MTTVANVPSKCSVCGGTTEFQRVTSTNAFGSPDLDLRPPEMRRSTMPYWVQTCPHCGYASGNIERETSVTRQWLSSDEYTSLTEVTGLSPKSAMPVLAKEFYLASKCYLADGDIDTAIEFLIDAAWDCDDAGDEAADFARKLRIIAANLMEEHFEDPNEEGTSDDGDDKYPQAVTKRLRAVDLLRRAGDLDKASALCSETKRIMSTTDCERILIVISAYEQSLLDKGDTGCHTTLDALHAEASLKDIIQDILRQFHS